MANNIEKVRVYSAANGGHATVATTAGLNPAKFIEVMAGRRRMTRQMAAAMAPLVGVSVTQLLKEDPDYQFMARKGANA